MSLLKLMKNCRRSLYKVTQPVLIFKSIEDHVIPVKSAEYTMKKISSEKKEIIWLKKSFHVATMDFDKDLVADKTVNSLKKL